MPNETIHSARWGHVDTSNAVSLTNAGFEDAQTIPGWTIVDGSGKISVSKAAVNGGSNSLEMIDTGSSQSPMVRSEAIPVTAGDKVIASVYANIATNGGAAYVDAIFSVWYCSADGTLLGQAYGPDVTTNGGWTQYTSTEITVPAQSNSTDVAGIYVAMYGGGSSECKAYYDDVSVTVNGAAATLNNSDFEAAQPIPGWTIEDGSGTIALSSSVVNGGNNSLEMIDTGAEQSPLIRSDVIPVNAGDKFSASLYANIASNGGAAYVDAIFSIWYCDASGNRIGQAYGPDITSNGGWNQYTSPEFVVPAQVGGKDVAGICVALYGGGSTECKTYFDDVQVFVEHGY